MNNLRKLTACLLAVLMMISLFPVSVFAQPAAPTDRLNGEASGENLPIIVTFDPNGGECEVETAEVNEAGKLAELPEAEWEGHAFAGWFTEAEESETCEEVTLETVFTEAATVYAHWTVAAEDSGENLPILVTFDPNGGVCAVETAEVNEEGKLTDLPEAAWEGYSFLGWFTEIQGGEKVTTETVFTEAATVYAHWIGQDESGENLPILITFDPNGGTCAVASAETVNGRLETLPEAFREGFHFFGWFTAAEGGEEVTTETVFTEAATVYAHWTPAEDSAEDLANVTWKNEDEVLKTEQVRKGTVPAYDGQTPAKDYDEEVHYIFDGWTDGTDTYGLTDELPAVEDDVTYTAVFAAEAHSMTEEVTTAATCTEEGLRTFTCECGYSYTETIEALGHGWSQPTFTFSEDGKTATATRVCARDLAHTETKDCTVTSEVTTEPTCTEPGVTTYTATVEFDGETYTDVTTRVDVEALGHAWSDPFFTFSENGKIAIALRVCANDPTHTETKVCTVTSEVTTEPTCTEPGVTAYTATVVFDGETYTETVTRSDLPATGHTPAEAVKENEVAPTCTAPGGYDAVVYCSVCGAELSREHVEYTALGHEWGEPTFTFSEDGKTATATRVCANDETHTETKNCIVTAEVTTPATCTEVGVTTYTAIVTFDDQLYTETTTRDDVPMVAHTPGPIVIENVVDPTCTEGGSYDEVIYCSVCGEELSRETFTTEAAGHVYGYPVIENEVDPTCTEDGSYDEVIYCDVCGEELSRETFTTEATGHVYGNYVIENEVDPTCTEDGGWDEVCYCEVCGEEIFREHNVISAYGHSWDYPQFTFVEDEAGNVTATATRVCMNDETHTETRDCTVEIDNSGEPTCTESGFTAYLASAEFDEEIYQEIYYVEGEPALGHAWSAPLISFSEDGKTANASRACANDPTHTETKACTVTAKVTKAATCTKAGVTTYTATVEFDGVTYKSTTKRSDVAKLGHDWDEGVVTKEPTEQEDGVKTYTCRRCGKTRTETIPTVKCPCIKFTDMPAYGTDEHTAIDWAYTHNPRITEGVSKTKFGPTQTVTRAQAMTFLWRAAGQPEPTSTNNPFTDVTSGKYYYKAVLWAIEKGITVGTSATTFSPNDTCNIEQIITFLYRYEGSPKVGSVNNPFTDVKSGKYYYKPIMWAYSNGIYAGKSATVFGRTDPCQRVQIVTFLWRDMGK